MYMENLRKFCFNSEGRTELTFTDILTDEVSFYLCDLIFGSFISSKVLNSDGLTLIKLLLKTASNYLSVHLHKKR